MSLNRILVAAIVMVFAVWGFVIGGAKAQSGGAMQAAPASSVPKKAEEQFKNIQTLKGIPADQLIPTMQFVTASLGVECEFCHVQGAFEKDDKKPKQTARKMMEMMFAINKDNFEGHRDVTCYSCHRGSTDPVGTPIISEEEPKTPEPASRQVEAKEATGPSADQLIDKFVQALGGAGAIDKVTSRVMKGTINFGGKEFPVDIYSKAPDKRASFVHMPEGDSATVFDGHEGWLGVPGHPLREMHGPDLDGAAIDADLHFATHLKQMFSEAKVPGTEKIGDHETYVVVDQREDKPPLRLYFDEQSGLLVRLVRYGETALGRLPTQVDYADYREANGEKIPFRWTLARPSGRFTIQLTEVKQNVPMDDAKFAKPPAPPEEQKGPAK
jgi:hypothetical protein